MINLYVASKSELGRMWKGLRPLWADHGVRIISTWIDECEVGQTESFTDLWVRCITEASSADAVLAYHREGDIWKGALVEIGAALAAGKKVLVFGHPSGSWVEHPNVVRLRDIGWEPVAEALR